jgi:hypothetical protein
MWSYLTSYSIIVAIAISGLLCDYVTSLDGNVMSREVGILFCFHNSAYCLMDKVEYL